MCIQLYMYRDVSRVHHCVLGCTRFPFGRIEYGTKGPIGRRKKNQMFMQITNARKNMRTAYFTRKLNILISHNREMIGFLKFQGKLLFSDFCSRIISFCQPWYLASEVEFWIRMCCVTWSELFFRWDNRRHFRSAASDNKTFQSKFSLLHAFQVNFKQ